MHRVVDGEYNRHRYDQRDQHDESPASDQALYVNSDAAGRAQRKHTLADPPGGGRKLTWCEKRC